jgi:hypothetical protein
MSGSSGVYEVLLEDEIREVVEEAEDVDSQSSCLFFNGRFLSLGGASSQAAIHCSI